MILSLFLLLGALHSDQVARGVRIGIKALEYPYNDEGQDTDDVMVSIKDMDMLVSDDTQSAAQK